MIFNIAFRCCDYCPQFQWMEDKGALYEYPITSNTLSSC